MVQLWWIIQLLIVKPLPQICYPLRRVLLRAFGAKIGRGVKIRPGVDITYPWKIVIGDYSWIGDGVALYSLGTITIGRNAVISQHSYLCAADHDYTKSDFPIRALPIVVEDQAWVASHVWIGPGVTVGAGTVVGARSTVTKNLPGGMVCVGSPCKPVKRRVTTS